MQISTASSFLPSSESDSYLEEFQVDETHEMFQSITASYLLSFNTYLQTPTPAGTCSKTEG